MGARSGIALKVLLWFLRVVQFLCSAIVLAIFSYFLATLHNHGLEIATWIRAVEGISGFATLYTGFGIILLWCFAGHRFTSLLAMVLDVAFAGAFIYVASSNRGGAGGCNGSVDTPFGSGDADSNVVDDGQGGFTVLPSFRSACQLETVCMSVSIVAIFFFLFSVYVEYLLVRHRAKENRFGPSPANNYTSGSGLSRKPTTGIGSLLFWRRRGTHASQLQDPNALPAHTTPDQVRASYATETTRVGSAGAGPYAGAGNKYFTPSADRLEMNTYGSAAPAAHSAHAPGTPTSRYGNTNPYTGKPAGYRYEDGVYEQA